MHVSQMLIGMFERVGEYWILATSCIYTHKKKSGAYTSVFHNFYVRYALAQIS